MSVLRHVAAIRNVARAMSQWLLHRRRAQFVTTIATCVVVSFIYLQVLGSQSPLN